MLNVGILAAAPYFDSNFLLMDDINSGNWQPGADILVLGDSRSHQGIIPQTLKQSLRNEGIEATAINLARPGQQLPFMHYFSNRVTETSEIKPRAVVLNISFYLLGGQQWMKDIYTAYYQPSLSDVRFACATRLLDCKEAVTWAIATRVPALTFRSRANTLLRRLLNDPAGAATELDGIKSQREAMRFAAAQGYMSRGTDHIDPSDVPMPHGYVRGIENGYSIYFRYLDQMIENLTSQGIEIFIYQFPWPEQRENESDFRDVLAYYDRLLVEHDRPGVHFLPTHRFWPTDLFIDPLHLNDLGAQRLSAELAAELAENPAFRSLFSDRQESTSLAAARSR